MLVRFAATIPLHHVRAGEVRCEDFLYELEDFLYELKADPAGGLRPPSGPAATRRSPENRPHPPSSWKQRLTARTNAASISGMRGIIRTLDDWVESRPWLTAAGAGLVVGSVVTTIEWALDDSPDWLFPLLLTLAFVLMVGFKGQAQRHQRRQG